MSIFSGCAVGPDYEPPLTKVPDVWRAELPGGLIDREKDPQALAAWWVTLGDPVLTGLIEQAISANPGVKEAVARVCEARAQRQISRAGLFPAIEASATGKATRGSENSGGGIQTESYSGGLDASWELDFFGGKRRSVESAAASYEASQEDLRDVMVSLLAEVALSYIEVRTYQARLEVARANLETQRETYELTQSRFQAGLADELDLEQARYNLESTRSNLPSLRTELNTALNRLATLSGLMPGALHDKLAEQRPLPHPPLEVVVGVPADVVRRRPDLRRAERKLAAQTAQIGVAEAELYPKITFSGSIGLEAVDPGLLFKSGNHTYGFGPSLSWPIFKAGSIRQNIIVQTALQEQLLHQYEAAVLTALEEVENAQVGFAEEQTRRTSLLQATAAAQKAVFLATNKFQAGLIGFSDVLEAQRSRLTLENDLVVCEGQIITYLVTLYKALGGGWKSFGSMAEAL